jgi:hypothetical protein
MAGRERTPSFFTTNTPRAESSRSPVLEQIPEEPNVSFQPSPSPLPKSPPSARKRKVLRRRQSTLARQLANPSSQAPVPEMGHSKYAREHVNSASRPFKLLEEGFLMDDLIKWVKRYAEITPNTSNSAPTEQTTTNPGETENNNGHTDGTKLPPLTSTTATPSNGKALANNPIYAQFLLESLQALRFSQQRSIQSVHQSVRELEQFLNDHTTEFNWHNRCTESDNNVGQTLCQAELVIVCLTALTELEMMFNATIRLADKVTELRRYWKGLESREWRFSAISISERWWNNELYEANSTAGRTHTCNERVEILNEVLDQHMILLGRTKRLMRQVYDIAHEDVELYEKYKSLMNWAQESFLVIENYIHLTHESNGSGKSRRRRKSGQSRRNDSSSKSKRDDGLTSSSPTLVNILDQMKMDYTETSSVLSPNLGPSIVQHLKTTLLCMPVYYTDQCALISHLNKPTLLQRRWPEFALGGIALLGGLYWAKKNNITKEDVQYNLSRFGDSCAEFIHEHVTEPAEEIYKEIFMDEYMEVTDPEEVEESKNSLRRNLRDYLIQKELQRLDTNNITGSLFSKIDESALSATTLARIQEISQGMKMSDVMRDYEHELSAPKSNLLMGNIVHLMLIQMQFMKKEIMVSMAKMDDVLKGNHLLVNTMSTVPAVVVSWFGYQSCTFIYKIFLQDDKERRDASLELRITLRDIDQCFNLVAHRSEVDVNGSEIYRMDLRDLGNLAMLLHRFDEQLNMYFLFGRVRPEVRYRMEEDMEELMMEDFSLTQRMKVVERIFRSYDVFHVHSNSNRLF